MNPETIEMPPLPQESQPSDEQPVHQLPEELQQAQQLQRESEEVVHAPIQEEVKEPAQESQQVRNFRQLREKAERLERERNEYMDRLAALELQKKQQQEAQQPEEEDLNFTIREDEFAEGKHLSKMSKKLARMETQMRQYQQQALEAAAQARLKAEFPDYDQVICHDNIEELKARYPEIANTLHTNPDLYSKASATYTIIKKMGIYQDRHIMAANEQRIKENLAKPRSLSSINPQKGDGPLTRVNAFAQGLTPELEKQLRKEMAESIANYGNK